MKRTTRAWAVVSIAAVGSLILSGCVAGSEGPAGSTADTTTIRTTIAVPATFDPAASQSLPDFLLARTSFDTLVRKDEGGVVAGLAASWTSTPLGAEFVLRSGITCSDGTPITPTIVQKSLEYFASGVGGGVNTAEVFGAGNAPVVTADDAAGTVSVALQSPWPYLLDGLALSSAGIICPAGLADPGAMNAGSVAGAESGPYVLKSFEPGVRYTFTLRDDYTAWPEWTTEIPGTPAKTLEYVVSPDSTATANLVLSGQLDVASIQTQTIERFESDSSYSVVTKPFSDYYLAFNERVGSPFADEDLRRAVVQAIDRTDFSEVTTQGISTPATSLVAVGSPCVPDSNPLIPEQDSAAAAATLNGATNRFIAPSVVGPAGAGNEYIAETLRAAGATVEFENADVGTWISRVLGQPDAWDLTLFADLNFLGQIASTEDSFLGPLTEDGGGNFTGVVNPAAEAAFSTALVATDDAQRCSSINASVDALIERSDVLPLLNDPLTYVVSPGFSYQALGGALDDPIFRIKN